LFFQLSFVSLLQLLWGRFAVRLKSCAFFVFFSVHILSHTHTHTHKATLFLLYCTVLLPLIFQWNFSFYEKENENRNLKGSNLTGQVLSLFSRGYQFWVPQTPESLEAYMIVNFGARGISWGARKLARIPSLIKKRRRELLANFWICI